ncbi:carboxylesterase family protein [Flavitalea flava]
MKINLRQPMKNSLRQYLQNSPYKKISLFLSFFLILFYTNAQQTAQKFIQETRYLLYLPEGYTTDTAKSWPLIVFLHGSGESGEDLEKVKKHGPPKLVEGGKQFPFIIVSPQTLQQKGWQPEVLIDLIGDIKKKYRVDEERVYLTGLSMGGFGTWSLAEKYPQVFAAIAPICGGGETDKVWKLAHMPVWCFHGALDNSVPIASSQRMIDALKPYNKDVKFTIYPEANHDSWTATYNNDTLYTWFLAQKKFKYQEVPVSSAVLKGYEGSYINAKQDTLKMVVEDGKLIALPPKQRFGLKAASPTEFFLNEHDLIHVTFESGKNGQTSGFVVYGNEKDTFKKLPDRKVTARKVKL